MADRRSGMRALARRGWLAVLAAVVGCAGPGGDSRPGGWVPFESREGNFRVLFPENPTYKTTADGKEHRYTVELRGGRVVLRAAYEHGYDTSIAIAERFAEVAKHPDVRGPVTPAALSLAGHPGMEATYEMRNGSASYVLRHRIYHVGRTSYQVMAVMRKGERAEAEVDRFFSSFQLLSPSTRPPPAP